MLANRQSWVSPGAMERLGLTTPLTVRVVGALLSIFSLTIAPSAVSWKSFRAKERSSMSRSSSGSRSISPSTTISPDMPPKTCSSEIPCWCEWYQ